jgi:hypothetical protein
MGHDGLALRSGRRIPVRRGYAVRPFHGEYRSRTRRSFRAVCRRL